MGWAGLVAASPALPCLTLDLPAPRAHTALGAAPHPCPTTDVLVQPLLFLSIYSSMTLPAAPFLHLYAVGVLVCLYCTSAGTLLSLVAPPSSALMATTGLLLIMGGMLNGVSPNYRGMAPALRALTAVSYNRRAAARHEGWGARPRPLHASLAWAHTLCHPRARRWAVEIVAVITFQHYPDWRRPAAKAVMNLAGGWCGGRAVGRMGGGSACALRALPCIHQPS